MQTVTKLQYFEVAALLGKVATWYQEQKEYLDWDETNGTAYAIYAVLPEESYEDEEFWDLLPDTASNIRHNLVVSDLVNYVEEEWIEDMITRLNQIKADYNAHYGKTEAI